MKGQIPRDKTIQMELLGDRLMSWLCSLDSLLSKKKKGHVLFRQACGLCFPKVKFSME